MFVVVDYQKEKTRMYGYFEEQQATDKLKEISKRDNANAVMLDLDKDVWASSLTIKTIARM